MKNKENNPVVLLKNIFFSYYGNDDLKYVLKDVTFSINAGEYICIVGHNGSGKSTISKIIAGLIKPQKGQLYICDKLITKHNIHFLRKKIGVIFQNPDNQFIGLSTEDDIAFGLENYCVKPQDMQAIIKNAANIIDITHLLKKESFNLSGGQKQKVAITSVLALIPQIIIFDESTSMLDPQAKLEIKALMKLLQTKYNRTIISITHDMEELHNADRILCMCDGQLVKFCHLDEFLQDYNFLKTCKLDLPFSLKLWKELHELNYEIKPSTNLKQIIESICKK